MTWECSNCSEQHTDEFDQCWSCGFQRDTSPSAEFNEHFNGLHECDWEDLRLGRAPYNDRPSIDLLQCQQFDAKTNNPSSPASLAELPAPNPFYLRFNNYFGRSKEALITFGHFRSHMAFWMAPIELILTPAKSSHHIRWLLKRIRWRVRKSRVRT